MSTTEKIVRYAALGIGLALVIFSDVARDWLVFVVLVIVLVYVVTILVMCVVAPEEIASWLQKQKWWRF